MAFSLNKNICQNGILNARVSGNRALKVSSPVRHMQNKRVSSGISAFMETANTETATPALSKVHVSIKLSLGYGEHIKIVGASPEMGQWHLDAAPEMTWNEGDVWTATLDLPAGFSSEYKFVHYIPGQEPIWEYTENRFLSIPQNLPSGTVALETAWCEPTTYGEEQNIFTTAAVATAEAQIENSDDFSPQEGLVTPAFQSAVDSVTAFLNGTPTEQEKMAEQGSEDVAALEAAFEAEAALKEQQKEEEEKIETEEEEEEAEIAAELAKPTTTEGKTMLESAAKTAGALALGVAGAALLSALAIDVADTAIIGAVAAAAGGAVLSGTGVAPSTKASRKTVTTEDGEEVEVEEVEVEEVISEERNITGAGEAGVIIAAGLASAFDIGRAMVDSMTSGAVEEEEESTKMDQE